MTNLFLQILNMSISATWLVLAVLLLRFTLKKAPKWVNVLLWGLVAVRLLCPFSLESALSLIPSKQTIPAQIMVSPTPQIHTGIASLNSYVNPILAESFTPEPAASANPLQILIPIAAALWAIGLCLMLLYTLFSYLRLRRQVRLAIRVKGNIYLSECVASPFVLGLFRPRIYLPYHMEEQDRAHVIAHERAHIRRRDHWWKPMGFLLLALHWFNPFMWLAYLLLCRDIEMACDERVIRELGKDQRADYSQALLHCSVTHRSIAACPIAFGEVGVKARVKNVLSYRKPAFWVIVLCLILVLVLSLCFLTDPKTAQSPFGWSYEVDHIAYADGRISFSYTPDNYPSFQLSQDQTLKVLEAPDSDTWLTVGVLTEFTLTDENFDAFLTGPSLWQDTSAPELRQENKQAWQVYTAQNVSGSTFYYLLLQENGELYLARGNQSESPTIAHIFKLLQADSFPLPGQAFQVSEVIFQTPELSSTWSFLDLPYLSVSGNSFLSIRSIQPSVRPDPEAPWTLLGQAKSLTLTTDNFDACFSTKEGQAAAKKLRLENKFAWQTRSNDGTLCYLLLQNDGTFCLAYGTCDFSTYDNRSFQYLLKLEDTEVPTWDVAMDIFYPNRTSANLSFYQIGGLSEGTLSVSSDYALLKKSDDFWEPLPSDRSTTPPASTQAIRFDSPAYEHLDWSQVYGTLPDGTYRIQKAVTLTTSYSQKETRNYYAEFSIGADTAPQVTLTLEDITPTGLTVRENLPAGTQGIVLADYFRLETFLDGQWTTLEPLPPKEAILADTDRRISVRFLDEENTYALDWTTLYGQLPAGSYRILQEYTFHDGQTPSIITSYAPFTIDENPGIRLLPGNFQENSLTVSLLPESNIQPGTYFYTEAILVLRNPSTAEQTLLSFPTENYLDHDITKEPPILLNWDSNSLSLMDCDCQLVVHITYHPADGTPQDFTLGTYFIPASYVWDIDMEIQKVTYEGLQISLTVPQLPQVSFSTSQQFTLEKRENNQWQPLSADTASFLSDSPVSLTPGKSTLLDQAFDDAYGTLSPGTYRICKQITCIYPDGTTEKRPIYAVFTLPDQTDSLTVTDGVLFSGENLWENFLTSVEQGTPATLNLRYIYNLASANHYAPELYEEIKDNFPLTLTCRLSYDGTSFTLTYTGEGQEEPTTYQHLRHFTGVPTEPGLSQYSHYAHYVLTDDVQATWQELSQSAASSQFGAYIPHFTVWSAYR